MTQYNTLNVKLSNSQLNKLRYAKKKKTIISGCRVRTRFFLHNFSM